uniref:hypothetical protein n=1 Tax=Acetatifactor sp. TaxID=1872090 RepID=UPI004055D214
MDAFGRFIMMIIEFLQRDFTLYGYTFSYWGVIMFTAVATIIGKFLWNLIFE